MYTRRRNPLANGLVLLLIGTLAGIAFLIYDNRNAPASTLQEREQPAALAPQVTQAATAEPTAQFVSEPEAVSQPTLLIPAAGVSRPIIEVFLDGTSWDVSYLGANVGHLQGTSWLDEPGNVVLSGHVELADGRRGVFASLKDVALGDTIITQHDGIERRYVVSAIDTVSPEDLTPLYPSDSDRLTLITCDNYDFWQDAYLDRTVVVAERVQ